MPPQNNKCNKINIFYFIQNIQKYILKRDNKITFARFFKVVNKYIIKYDLTESSMVLYL